MTTLKILALVAAVLILAGLIVWASREEPSDPPPAELRDCDCGLRGCGADETWWL